jgi:hypothetical protein
MPYLLLVLMMLSCTPGDVDSHTAMTVPVYQWLSHPCGNFDPVGIDCMTEDDKVWEEPSVTLCEDLDVSVGDACSIPEGTCVSQPAFTCESGEPSGRSSEYLLYCRAEPFEDKLCPESSRNVKSEIRYLAPTDRAVIAQEILDVKLADYRYRDAPTHGPHLGYILEDQPDASFSGDGRVDIYAYISAVVALGQQQQQQIVALREEVSKLQRKAVCVEDQTKPTMEKR